MADRAEIAGEKFLSIFIYQFGPRVGKFMETILNQLKFTFSRRTGRFKSVTWKGMDFCNFKPDIGMFALGSVGAKFLLENLFPPALRVIVQDDVGDYIAHGRNVFAKHVVGIDTSLLPEDEVIIVDTHDRLLGLGRLLLPAIEVKKFNWGVAVKTRKGCEK
ncbi:MAG: PUA domain containing protein [Promethearchaeota archaeon CR_4]|nr:MAG: PUA domain containing protein [Candidatus Lokiarchaeota archaeon CR_4]